MTDRNVQYPTRYRMTKVASTDDIYEMEPVPGEVTDEGTIINKAALLKDATAALFGFTAEQLPGVVPDDIFAFLSKAALLNEDGNVTDFSGEIKGVQIATGSYTGTGTYGSANPCSLTFDFPPKLVVISNQEFYCFFDEGKAKYGGFNASDYTTGSGMIYGLGGTMAISEKTLSWYSSRVTSQMNVSGNKYRYFCIGYII